jgi:excisionase family DNA binding protein
MPEEPMMTPEQVAEWLQVHKGTVYRWIDEGKLPALRIGRAYRIPRSEVLAMVKQQGGPDAPEECDSGKEKE